MIQTLKRAPVMALVALFAASTAAMAGLNPQVTFPLHYKASSFEACTGVSPVDCTTNRPVVAATSGSAAAIFLLVHNTTSLAGVQTAFQFDGTWLLTFGLWDCQGGQLNAVTPAMPGGPTAGAITTAFNCVTTGGLIVIGRMFFTGPTAGCISQVQPTYPFGIHALDCVQGTDQITEDARLGKVCVGAGGVDACDPVSAVEGATWGGIKAQYH